MTRLFHSTAARLALASFASAMVALFLMAAEPFPHDAYGQAPAATGAASTGAAAPQTGASPVTASSPATSGATPATSQGARPQVTVAQQPVALPRTGTGIAADSSPATGAVAFGFLGLAAALGSAGLVLRARRARR